MFFLVVQVVKVEVVSLEQEEMMEVLETRQH